MSNTPPSDSAATVRLYSRPNPTYTPTWSRRMRSEPMMGYRGAWSTSDPAQLCGMWWTKMGTSSSLMVSQKG